MNKKITSCLVAVACAAAVTFTACGESSAYTGKRVDYNKFNTQANLVVFDDFNNSERVNALYSLNEELGEFLNSLENSLSTKPLSTAVEGPCIYRFNQAGVGEKVEVDKITYDVMNIAKSVYELTEGYYNPAVYYCVDLYGFTPTANLADYPRVSEQSKLPTQEYVTAFRDLSAHFAQIEISEENGKYFLTKPEGATVTVGEKEYTLKIDLGGVGKGYAADFADGLCKSNGFKYGYFNFGSSSMAIYERYAEGQGADYALQFIDPRPATYGAAYAQINTKNTLLSTSGDYEKYYEENGVRYCHIIDPTTGSPIDTGIASCTIIGGTAAQNDALTTALSAMGKQGAVEFINKRLSDRTVIFTCDKGDGTMEVITNRPQDVVILQDNYKIVNTVDTDGKIVLN